LGDSEFVGQLLKEQVGKFIHRAEAFAGNEMTAEAISTADLADCNALTRIFAGQNAAYSAMKHWNSQGGLAAALREALTLPQAAQGDDQAAIFCALQASRDEVYKTLIPAMQGKMDGDEAGRIVGDVMHKYALLFAGVPS
jgi:hypothetical protein